MTGGGAYRIPIVPDGLDGAGVHRFLTLRFLAGCGGLTEDVGEGLLLVPPEVLRSGDAADIAVDALRVDVVLACGVLREPVAGIGHGRDGIRKVEGRRWRVTGPEAIG